MPLQNRVTPSGELIRTEHRGDLMGNRGGVIHANKEIVRPYQSRRWIACLLEFKGRRRSPMSPNKYTELFFLDEATALAAGHRPCAECRRDRFIQFRQSWPENPTADIMDRALHPARIDKHHNKVTITAPLPSLPQGAFINHQNQPHLLWNNTLLPWTPAGYAPAIPLPATAIVTVLTPAPILACLHNGYQPTVHSSATQV